jgi:hypothetical protein
MSDETVTPEEGEEEAPAVPAGQTVNPDGSITVTDAEGNVIEEVPARPEGEEPEE